MEKENIRLQYTIMKNLNLAFLLNMVKICQKSILMIDLDIVLMDYSIKKLVEINLPDEHLISGSNHEMFAYYGLDDKGIVSAVEKNL